MELNEEVNPSFNVERGLVGVNVDAVRDNINILLAGVTNCSTVTPYIALERVRKVLAQFHIFLPKVTFMEGDHGVQTFPIQQFGEMMGMRNDGEVVSKVNDPYHLYFEYQMSDRGMFDVFCEIVNNDELEELLNDVEDEIDDEDAEDEREAKLDESSESVKLSGPETGPKTIDGAPEGMNVLKAYLSKKKDQKLNEAKKEKPHKVKYKPFPGISPSKGNYDAQWKHSEKMNPYHATKQNLKAFKRFAMAEFKKLRKGPPNFEEYKKGYNKHQERLDNIIKLMGIIKAKEKAEKLRKA